MFGQRILILVPHPDDEVVGFSAAIGRAQQAGATIFALYLTHGCIAQETLWPWQRRHHATYVTRRHDEGKAVARFLKITPAGWNNTRPARHVWRDLSTVFTEVKAAIKQHAIDQIWTPAYEGGNADHDATNAVARLFLPHLSVLEFAEYNYAEGRAQSQHFPDPRGHEVTITLTAEEREKKRQALALYVSEQMNLDYVKTERECYRPMPAAQDYSMPPHKGTLWYARFQWVPFRHPRVDFTNPHDVSVAITNFLRENPSGATASAPPVPATR